MERYNHRWMGVVSILSVVMVQLVAMLGQAVNPTPAQAADLPPLSASLHVHGV